MEGKWGLGTSCLLCLENFVNSVSKVDHNGDFSFCFVFETRFPYGALAVLVLAL